MKISYIAFIMEEEQEDSYYFKTQLRLKAEFFRAKSQLNVFFEMCLLS
jgi:hypothetical protein